MPVRAEPAFLRGKSDENSNKMRLRYTIILLVIITKNA